MAMAGPILYEELGERPGNNLLVHSHTHFFFPINSTTHSTDFEFLLCVVS